MVRSRHAHAWSQAYIGGRWENLDTTPAVWIEYESERSGIWQPVTDLWAWARFKFTRWLSADSDQTGGVKRYLLGSLLVVLVVLGAALFRRKRVTKVPSKAGEPEVAGRRPGDDSPFYLVQARIASWGFSRARPEPLTDFVARVGRARPEKRAALDELEMLLTWHYRYRFDPEGAPAEEVALFRQAALTWLEETVDRDSAKP